MSFRACFAFLVVLYMAVLLVQVDVANAANATEAAVNATPAAAANATEAPPKATDAPATKAPATKAPATKAPATEATTKSGVESMYSVLPFATYALWLVLVAVL